MNKATATMNCDHTSLKMLVRALDSYGANTIFGSPLEQETFKELQWQLRTALCELQFEDNN